MAIDRPTGAATEALPWPYSAGMDNELGGFAAPPFKPDAALERLRRELRTLGLAERGGQWLLGPRAIARVALTADGQALDAALVERPAHSPSWRPRVLRDHTQLRDFTQAVTRLVRTARDEE